MTTPQPKRAPRCANCKRPFILRYHENVMRLSETPIRMRRRWVWIRDCDGECRREQPKALAKDQAVKIDKLTAQPVRRARRAT